MQEDQAEWFKQVIATASEEICDPLASDDRFSNAGTLIGRFQAAAGRLIERGLDHLREFDEVLNEINVALQLLSTESRRTVGLAYEPSLPGCTKRIDFRRECAEAPEVEYLEVKSIHPTPQDDWEKFRWVVEKNLLPENVHVILDQDWLGGEIWHNLFAARSKMLDYSLEFELRITECFDGSSLPDSTLVFCSNGFSLHEDELEDFVAYYRRGVHRADDPLSRMEEYDVRERSIELTRSISRFAYVERANYHVHVDHMNWDVQ